ncbi:hypothetical protein CapIbe_008737 [Capra ibex]
MQIAHSREQIRAARALGRGTGWLGGRRGPSAPESRPSPFKCTLVYPPRELRARTNTLPSHARLPTGGVSTSVCVCVCARAAPFDRPIPAPLPGILSQTPAVGKKKKKCRRQRRLKSPQIEIKINPLSQQERRNGLHAARGSARARARSSRPGGQHRAATLRGRASLGAKGIRAQPRGEWQQRVLVLEGEGGEVDPRTPRRVRGLMRPPRGKALEKVDSTPGGQDVLGIQDPGVGWSKNFRRGEG